MRTALVIFALAVALRAQVATAPAGAHDTAPDSTPHAFVEIVVPRPTCFVGERVDVGVRIAYDAAFFKSNGIPLFRREVDVPLRLRATWLRELAGATLAGAFGTAQPPDRPRMSLAVNDAVVDASRIADRVIDGRTFTVVELVRPLVATRAGQLTIPETTVDFAFANRFTDDIFSGRVAADRHDAHVTGAPVTLTVAPLPDSNRPSDFSGAVGRFTVTAAADTDSTTVGRSLHLVFQITGGGNLQLIDTPRIAAIHGFRILGMIDARGIGDRTVTFDIAPTSDSVTAIPAVPFSFFDPDPPGAYRTAVTLPLRLTVTAPTVTSRVASRPDPPAPPAPPPPDAPSFWPIALYGAGVIVLSTLVAHWRARSRERDARDPAGVRARNAAAAFRAHVAANTPLADAFAGYLAAHLRCSAPAVITADLASRLTSAGASPADSTAAAALLDELTHARYGGAPPANAVVRASALVTALDPALMSGAKPRR